MNNPAQRCSRRTRKSAVKTARMKYVLAFGFLLAAAAGKAQQPAVQVDWNTVTDTSRSTATLQVVGNPMLRRSGAMHDGAFQALRDLQADYVRYVPWFPYPRLAVAELEPPGKTTSWDFSLIDPMTIDFFENTRGHSVLFNFSTIPQWMFRTEKPVAYPKDPNEVSWNYGGGTELRDTTLKELTDYYVRLASWYTKGGFTDELGKYHRSGHHYPIAYWEVLNEPDLEHTMTPQTYTKIYDAVVSALKPVLPDTKFVGLALAYEKPEWFEYFLNPAHHKPGIPVDMISYHCYAGANPGQPFEAYEYAIFDKAESFVHSVSYIENIRKRLSPATRTDINELGTFVNADMRTKPIPPSFWNLSAGVYAYFFIELTKAGIDVIGESQLVGYPSQFPDVSMINYENNRPNPRYHVLRLIRENIPAGSRLLKTSVEQNGNGDILAQAFLASGTKKVLILNKRNREIRLKLPAGWQGAQSATVDAASGDNPARVQRISTPELVLKPFAVSLITIR